MKFAQISTTSKVYLLTLFLIFIILFLNQSVFAQSEGSKTVSRKRLETMKLYLSWIDGNEYGQFQKELGKKVLENFKSFLSRSVQEDKDCLNPNTPPTLSFLENITAFFSQLNGSKQKPQTDEVAQKLSGCKVKIKLDYKQAKKYNRLLKYLQIEEGRPNVCIKADLGIGTALKARGFNPTKVDSDNPKETGRTGNLPVYLCTGQDGKKKVRVVDDSGTRLRLAPEDAAKAEFKIENLPPKDSFNKLVEKLGL